MIQRKVFLAALVVIMTHGGQSYIAQQNGVKGDRREWCASVCGEADAQCAPPCQACPAIPPCPKPICPEPKCPAFPPIPPCPQPKCPTPVCPQPVCSPSPPRPCPIVDCPKPTCKLPPPCPKCATCPPLPKISPIRKPRPAGYEGLPCSPVGIYKFYANTISWTEANNTCFRDGAHLLIPNTMAELATLKNIMKQKKVPFVHVGFHDTQKDGHYVSVLGEPISVTQRGMWAASQPSGGTRENCAVMHKDNDNMHDWPCTSKFPFVCEVPY